MESIETRKDAQLARELNIALPHEITDAERLELVRDFARSQFVSRGMVVDFAIHHPAAGGKGNQRNIHAHLMLTLRRATPDGLGRVKTRQWNSDKLLIEWRTAWSAAQNLVLARGGHLTRVDHRTLEAQREEARAAGNSMQAAILDRAPEVHVGPRAAAAAYRGRTPPSQERTARTRQQPRKRPESGSRSAKRQVRYPEFDRGSRQEWNREVVTANRARLAGFSDRRERQLMRFRHHEARALRLVAQINRQLAGKASEAGKGFWGRGKPKEPVALLEARRARALGRAKLARGLVADLERVLAQTLGMQRRHTERHRKFSRTWRDDALETRSRGRSRTLLD